ncbi:MAG: helix-turn-helix domain-containing protein [Candidatus Thiodiazotropha sp.]
MQKSCCLTDSSIDERLLEVACSECGLDPMCQVLDYAEPGSGVPAGILLRRQPVTKGEQLFHVDEPFTAVYAVKSGSFKATVPDLNCDQRVVGFYLPGDLIGAEGMAHHTYSYSVRALESSSVCVLEVARLHETGRSIEAVQQALIEMLGQEVALNHRLTASLIRQNADQRLAAFILSLSLRASLRGLGNKQLNLGMSRSDMASYLGLARETISRGLTRFQRKGLIRLRKQNLILLDEDGLQQIATCC